MATPDETVAPRDGHDPGSATTVYRIVACLTAVSVLIGAVRAGLDGWMPVFDSAGTVLRARFALGMHPDLLGIYTDASNWAGAPTFFPGPWWLWWMSIPIRILGPNWGPLLSIAALNIIWILAGGWAVKRAVGPRAATAALIFLAALIWSLGIATTYSPSGQVMIVIPFAAFVFVAWALAVGDETVLPVFAVLVNFLLLDEVVLIRIVPMIAVAACVVWAAGLLHARRHDRAAWMQRRRRVARSVVATVVIGLVAWAPTLIQQVTHHPGNLTNLWRANAASPPVASMWGRAWEILVSLFVRPPFWLRGSRTRNALLYTPPPSTIAVILVTLALVGLIAVLGVLAWRRRDRAAFTAQVMAVAVVVAAWFNMAHPPDPTGLPTFVGYYLSTWAVAMFVTFSIGFGVVRTARFGAFMARLPSGRHIRFGAGVAVGCAALLFVGNLPRANFAAGTYDSGDEMLATAKVLVPAVIEATQDRGRVEFARSDIYGTPYLQATAVQLEHRGTPFCVDGVSQWADIEPVRCPHDFADVIVRFLRTEHFDDPEPGERVIATHAALGPADVRQLRELRTRVRAAIAAAGPLEPTDRFVGLVDATMPPGPLRDMVRAPDFFAGDGPMATRATTLEFAAWLGFVDGAAGDDDTVAVEIPGISTAELLRWARLERTQAYESFTVTMTPTR